MQVNISMFENTAETKVVVTTAVQFTHVLGIQSLRYRHVGKGIN